MPDVWLGPVGNETKLPILTWMGSPPSWPVQSNKQVEVSVMADRSRIVSYFGDLKEFKIAFGFLSADDLAMFKAINKLKEILRYKNEHEDNTWYSVVISAFRHYPERMDVRQLERYRVEMTLKETNRKERIIGGGRLYGTFKYNSGITYG